MRSEVIEKIAALMTAAFGLVAALAWNGAIRGLFDKYYAVGEGIGALFWYAIIVTIIAVFATIYIGKAADKAKAKEDKSKSKKK